MNVMHDNVQANLTVETGREKIKEQITRFLFEIAEKEQWDVDRPVVRDRELLSTIKKEKKAMDLKDV